MWNKAMRSLLCGLVLMLSVSGTTIAKPESEDKGKASSKLTYNFSNIQVLYAAEFNAYPAGTSFVPGQSVSVSSSVYGSVYGAVYGPQPLRVLYGVVSLDASTGMQEEFIKVSEGAQSVRGLSNGTGWENYGQGHKHKELSTEFVTGKKLEGNSVVKDYSDGWKTIKLTRYIDEYSNLTNMHIQFGWDMRGSHDPFFQRLTETSYVVDMSSLKYVGKQGAQP
ncbi:hypothetical protein [Paenibacillus sp. YYML68]|uniref:hypothetical protein n=1 Tax=Paenibacillus sp. YYML68 TaxID=2909250 RepID=UPI002490EA21|nr:hypothetical protein [Paenibacillus sp. YYML68]